MNSQEIETALRIRTPMVILIWVDNAYGLISWKMDLEIGHNVDTRFNNPDFVAYAESFGAKGYRISSADELLPDTARSAGDGHRQRHRLPGRLLRQQRPDRLARRTGRVLVLNPVMKLPVKPPVSPMLSKSVPAIPPSASYEPSESQTSIGVRVGSSRWPGLRG